MYGTKLTLSRETDLVTAKACQGGLDREISSFQFAESPSFDATLILLDQLTGLNTNSNVNEITRTFAALLALCAGNSPVTGEFPSQRPVTRSFDIFFNLRLNKRSSKNHAHYDVNKMALLALFEKFPSLAASPHQRPGPDIPFIFVRT